MKIIIGITGAAGTFLSKRAVELLYGRHELSVIATESGQKMFHSECGQSLYDFLRKRPGIIKPDNSDFGSAYDICRNADMMILLPCSAAAVGKTVTSSADSLLGFLSGKMIAKRRLTAILSDPAPNAIDLANLSKLSSFGVSVLFSGYVCRSETHEYADTVLKEIFSDLSIEQ